MNRSKRLFTLIVTGWTKHAMATNTGITQRATYWGEIYTWFIPLLRWNIYFIHPITEVKYTEYFIDPITEVKYTKYFIHPITEVKYTKYFIHPITEVKIQNT